MSYEDLADLLGEDTFDYVEDTFLEADDLAEHAVPSPPLIIDEDDFDIDLWQYDYWMDIDYGSDGDEIRHRQRISRRTRKRKLNALTTDGSGKTSAVRRVSPSKRRKVLPPKSRTIGSRPTGKVSSLDQLPPVVMMKHAILQRYEPQETRTLDVKPLQSSSLLSNWREQFKNTPMWERKRPTVELEHVEDAPDDDGDGERLSMSVSGEDVSDDVRALLAAGGEGEDGADEEWEDEVEEEEVEEEEEEGGEGMDLDPEALKMAIQQNLAAAGINIKGMDQEMLMSMAMQMFSGGRGGGGGGEASDAMLGRMTDTLLGGRNREKGGEEETEDEEMTEDEDSGFKGWVTKQAEEKAAAREKEANDKDKDKDKADLPTPASSHGKPSQSPPDKRQQQPQHQQEEDATAGADAQEQRGTKRKAETVVELDVSELNASRPKKTARARFDAPTAASKARSVSGGAQVAVPAQTKKKGRK